MTNTRDSRGADFGSPVADSAACLLIVGGYREYVGFLSDVVAATKDELLTSPALGDFFEVRLVDMGPRPPHPSQPADLAAGVSRLILELTSRPDEAARNYSALVVIDRYASTVDQVLRGCRSDRVLSDLKVRLRGLASVEDRSAGAGGGSGPEIAIAPGGTWGPDALVTEVVDYANRLLSDFGSGLEQGFPVEGLDQLGARAELEHRGTVQAAAQAEAEARRNSERRRKEEREAQRRREAEPRRETEPRWETEPRRQADPAAEEEFAAELGRAAAAEVAARDKTRQPDADRPREPRPTVSDQEPRAESTSRKPGAGKVPRARGRSRLRGRSGTNADVGVNILLKCLDQMDAGDSRNFEGYLAALRGYAGGKLSTEDRQRSRDIIEEQRLWLSLPGQPPDDLAAEFYSVLLRIVYGLPVAYPAYCEIEDFGAARDVPVPQPVLLAAMNVVQPADIRVTAITHYYLGPDWLTSWFRSGKASIGQLITALAGEWDRPRHAEILDYATFQYLVGPDAPKLPRAVRSTLREHGYLAAALQARYPGRRGNQVAMLFALLGAAFPDGLDRPAAEEVFNVSAPTRALAEAVVKALPDPADRTWAARQFMAHRYEGEKFTPGQEAEIVRALTAAPME